MKAVILFSHGSTLCGAGKALDRHAERLRVTYPLVEVGYLNYSTPSFEDSVKRVVAAGATHISVVPFFLIPGYFVGKSLPETVDVVRRQFPNVQFFIGEPLGSDPLLAEALIWSAEHPLESNQWREGLEAAAIQCRFSSECPVYGTPACPPTFLMKRESDGA